MHFLDLMALLAIALLISKLLGGLFESRRIPSVLAELLVGIIIGNIGIISDRLNAPEVSQTLQAFSELGVLLLLFVVGLETNIKDMQKVGFEAGLAAVYGVVIPFIMAFIIVPLLFVSNFAHSLFMAAALTATSVGITARVLADANKTNSVSGRIILGAAVIDDILGIIVLAIVSALATTGTVSTSSVAILFGKIGIFAVIVAVARRLIPATLQKIQPYETSGSVTIFLLSLCLLAAWLADKTGLAGIIGAFALGMALDDVHFKGYRATERINLGHLMKPITDFLSPIFFIVMGMGVKLDSFNDKSALFLMLVLVIIGIIGKLACGLAITKKSKQAGADPLLVGFGMIPRGEVGLIFALMGKKLGVLNPSDFAAVVGMVAITTLVAPFLINWRTANSKSV